MWKQQSGIITVQLSKRLQSKFYDILTFKTTALYVLYVMQVSYSDRVEDYLPLPIPLEKATNEEEFQKYEARKQEADAKGVKYVILVLLITFL